MASRWFGAAVFIFIHIISILVLDAESMEIDPMSMERDPMSMERDPMSMERDTGSISPMLESSMIPNSFLMRLSDSCDRSCRDEANQFLSASDLTKGCRLDSEALAIGSLNIEPIECDREDMRSSPRSSMRYYHHMIIKTISEPLARAGTRPLLFENSRTVTIQSVPSLSRYKKDIGIVTGTPPGTDFYGIDEIDGGFPTDGNRTCSLVSNNGKDVDIWILDTGCTNSPGGLCANVLDPDDGPCPRTEGHGVDMGMIATDSVFGVAPEATRHCVRVIPELSSGSFSNVIRGFAVVSDFVQNNTNPSSKGNVINLSLAGVTGDDDPDFLTLNAILGVLSDEFGIYVSGAVGNFNQETNACDTLPAAVSTDRFFRVQAHDVDGNPYRDVATAEGVELNGNTVSTVGRDCIDISAPGVDILLPNSSSDVTREVSGTSLATAYVSGAIAILLSDDRAVNMSSLTESGRLIDNGLGFVDKPSVGLSCPVRMIKEKAKYY
ncbi:unnamed protein product [Agarophyton chilense]